MDGKHPGRETGIKWLTAGIILLGLIKLYLVSNEDIVRQAWDPVNYARMITNRIWFGEYDNLVYRPGTALVGVTCRLLGVRYRLGLELAYLGAAFLAARALFTLTRSRLLYLSLFALLAFHPWSFHFFRFLRSEPPFMIAGLLVLTGLITLLQKKRIGFFSAPLLLTGLALALWDTFRIETVLVLATYLVGAFAILIRPGASWSRWRRELLALAIPPLLLFSLQYGIKWCNYLGTGVYTLSVQENPGFIRLMNALYRVDTPDAFLHAPVTRASLTAACRVSPTLGRFQEELLDPNRPNTRAGAELTGRGGEFGQNLNWVIHCSIQGRDLAETDQLMSQAAEELDAALAEGRLPHRTAVYPIDPNYGIWIPKIPDALLTNLGDLFSLPEWKAMGDDTSCARTLYKQVSGDRHQFDLAAGRRAVQADRTTVVLEGFVTCGTEEAQFVALEDASGTVLGVCSPRTQPVSLPPVHPQEGSKDSGGLYPLFNLIVEVPTDKGLALSVWKGGSPAARVPLAGLPFGFSKHPTFDGKGEVLLDIWRHYTSPPREGWQWPATALPWVTGYYGVALVIILLALFIAGFGRTNKRPGRGLTLCLFILTAAVLIRLFAYTFMLASLGWRDPRYMQCFTPLVIPLILVAALWLGGVIGPYLRHRGGEKIQVPQES